MEVLNSGLTVILSVMTGIVATMGGIGIAIMGVRAFPTWDDPTTKTNFWKGSIGLVGAVIVIACFIWGIPWIFGLFSAQG